MAAYERYGPAAGPPDKFNIDAEFLLLSYPRSGSTWLRYCIEFLTERPTFGYIKKIRNGTHVDTPFFKEYLTNEPIALKRHKWDEDEARSKRAYRKMILLVRNYKEAMLRDDYPLYKFKDLTILETIEKDYIKLLEKYHNHEYRVREKAIVYYEDLILEPKKTLDDLMKAMKVPKGYEKKLEQLMTNFEEHKNRSAGKYRSMQTHLHHRRPPLPSKLCLSMPPGVIPIDAEPVMLPDRPVTHPGYNTNTVDNKDMYFHRRAAIECAEEEEELKDILITLDEEIEKRWPELFELYLKRYREIE